MSGNGKYKFRVLYTSSHLPSEAQTVLKGAHGGFTVDLRPGKGETYFSLKGAGIIQISSDLKSTRMIAEGVPNTESLHHCARKAGVRTPLLDEVYAVLYENKSAKDALLALLGRDPRPEAD